MNTHQPVLSVGRAAPATTPPSQPDTGAPTGADAESLQFMLGAELAARDLYRAAHAEGAATPVPDLIVVLADNHGAYADSLAAIIGASANESADAGVFEERQADFETSDVPALAGAAYQLESELVATHIELVGEMRNRDAAELLASILISEARHCAIVADLSGNGNDLEALLENPAEPLSSPVSSDTATTATGS
ncbi:MAG: ferritin-like domain-containing protein [Actinomycetota bacterium]|nr:ferritin-like domain-containing protein [Actinomycetota bacterium]